MKIKAHTISIFKIVLTSYRQYVFQQKCSRGIHCYTLVNCGRSRKKIQGIRVASIIGHAFKLTCAAICDKLLQEAKVNHCNGCAIQHPSQREHSCPLIDSENAWTYYHDQARVKTALDNEKKPDESVFTDLGFTLGQTWQSYLTDLLKFPWTRIYLTSL